MAPKGCCSARVAVPGGYSFFVQGGKLVYVHNYVARDYFKVESGSTLPEGRHKLRFEFEPTGDLNLLEGKGAPGRFQLYVDGDLVGETDVPYTTPMILNPGALTCGANPGSSVTPDYVAPFRFTGTIHTVTVDVSGDLIVDTEAEMRVAMARQ